jgi:hypothetical protein
MRSWQSFLVLAIGAMLIAPLAATASPVVYTITTEARRGHICRKLTGSRPRSSSTNPGPERLDAARHDYADSSATVAPNISVASATFLAIGDADNGVDDRIHDAQLHGHAHGRVVHAEGPNTTISWLPRQSPP